MSAAEIRGWARAVDTFRNDGLSRGAEVWSQAILDQARADTGGDGRFSNGPGLGTASTDVRVGGSEAQVIAVGFPIWGILQYGTGRHEIRAHGQALSTPYGPRRSVTVSGVRARGTFTSGAERGQADVMSELGDAWQAVFG